MKAITILYLLAVSITWSSRMLPPGSATYLTPLSFPRSMLSPKGKKASLPKVTPSTLSKYSRFSASVNSSGFSMKYFCQLPSARMSSSFLLMYASTALSLSGRPMSSLKGRFKTLGCWRNHQVSALLPARRVQ